ncbi:MAG: 2OG-Fe(II) oxygenase family protein [Synechococcaceae cyanobacterium]|nr:2OG-Fe(II) oxygenase family protein [Synechococcaceae cyanobacterium]
MESQILDVDLLRFERGGERERRGVIDGVMRSLTTGFVYASSDLPEDLLDETYGLLRRFFCLPEAVKQSYSLPDCGGQTGYTAPLREQAVGSDLADWKEMLNWSLPLPASHPLRRRFPLLYPEQLLPEAAVPGISVVLDRFHRQLAELQRRVLRIIALGMGCAESYFDTVVRDAPTLTRALHYPPMAEAPRSGHLWAAPHGDINLITALPRATAPGLQVLVEGNWIAAAPPEGRVILNTGLMLERLSNGRIPAGWHRVVAGEEQVGGRLSVVQFCHPTPWTVLAPVSSCCGPADPPRWPGLLAADALEEVLHQLGLTGSTAGEPQPAERQTGR